MRDFTVPIGTAAVVHEGVHATIATYGSMTRASLRAADALAGEGVSVEVLDLRTLSPLDEDAIVARVVDDLHHAFPAARGIQPIEVRAVKEKRATFAATPDVERRRPRVEPGVVGVGGGGIENLYLAGDWCDTGWPATMEGAVRSGYAAASAITGDGGIQSLARR